MGTADRESIGGVGMVKVVGTGGNGINISAHEQRKVRAERWIHGSRSLKTLTHFVFPHSLTHTHIFLSCPHAMTPQFAAA